MKTDVIILAAGIGSRLRPLTNSMPKTMIDVNGKSIIRRLMDQLSNSNDINIHIVAGYKQEILNEFLKSNKDYKYNFIINDDYEITNNMYSLFLALNILDNSNKNNLVIINADCVYDDRIVEEMLSSVESCIAIDENIFNNESMKVLLDDNKLVKKMSKSINNSEKSFVSMDIYNFNQQLKRELFVIVSKYIEKGDLNSWTEVAIDELVQKGNKVKVRPFKNKWMEIDDLNDLKKAEEIFVC